MQNPKRVIPTGDQILAEQKAAHAKTTAVVKATPQQPVAIAPGEDALGQYLEQVSDGPPGRLIKFSTKTGNYTAIDDGSEVDTSAHFAALCDQVMVGWIKFNEDGEPPEKIMGLPSEGFLPPPREVIGDTDESAWPVGLNGEPSDPWKHQQLLPLQDTKTQEVLVFTTLTATGHRSVARLLQHYRRIRRAAPDELPVVQLRVGGFRHRDARVGMVATPEFRIVGRIKRDGTPVTMPDPDDLNDSLPF
jgi:hypothetical protein